MKDNISSWYYFNILFLWIYSMRLGRQDVSWDLKYSDERICPVDDVWALHHQLIYNVFVTAGGTEGGTEGVLPEMGSRFGTGQLAGKEVLGGVQRGGRRPDAHRRLGGVGSRGSPRHHVFWKRPRAVRLRGTHIVSCHTLHFMAFITKPKWQTLSVCIY